MVGEGEKPRPQEFDGSEVLHAQHQAELVSLEAELLDVFRGDDGTTLELRDRVGRAVAGGADFDFQAQALSEMFAQDGLQPDAAFAFRQGLDGDAQHHGVALHAGPLALARQFGGQPGDRQARGQAGPFGGGHGVQARTGLPGAARRRPCQG